MELTFATFLAETIAAFSLRVLACRKQSLTSCVYLSHCHLEQLPLNLMFGLLLHSFRAPLLRCDLLFANAPCTPCKCPCNSARVFGSRMCCISFRIFFGKNSASQFKTSPRQLKSLARARTKIIPVFVAVKL